MDESGQVWYHDSEFFLGSPEVTIHSRFRIDNRCVVLARKHLLSILKPDCEAVTPPT